MLWSAPWEANVVFKIAGNFCFDISLIYEFWDQTVCVESLNWKIFDMIVFE